jgi:hypothetical protein
VSELPLSIVCVVGCRAERLERLNAAIAAQSARDELELVLVGGDGETPAPAGIRCRRVAWPPAGSYGEARAAGASEAGGEIVAFLLDHGYPEPGWAEALIAAYRGRPWAAVGYRFRDANPATYASRATYLAHFGPWESAAPGKVDLLPGNMVSYRRSQLSALGDELGELLEIDSTLHRRLAGAGLRLAIEPQAVVRAECFESVFDTCRGNAVYARMLAALRAHSEGWPVGRRLISALLAPALASALRLVRIWRGSSPPRTRLVRYLPALAAICVGWGLGVAGGYLLGAGDAPRRLVHWELDAIRARP